MGCLHHIDKSVRVCVCVRWVEAQAQIPASWQKLFHAFAVKLNGLVRARGIGHLLGPMVLVLVPALSMTCLRPLRSIGFGFLWAKPRLLILATAIGQVCSKGMGCFRPCR